MELVVFLTFWSWETVEANFVLYTRTSYISTNKIIIFPWLLGHILITMELQCVCVCVCVCVCLCVCVCVSVCVCVCQND